jgi:hypothetical protein
VSKVIVMFTVIGLFGHHSVAETAETALIGGSEAGQLGEEV